MKSAQQGILFHVIGQIIMPLLTLLAGQDYLQLHHAHQAVTAHGTIAGMPAPAIISGVSLAPAIKIQ